MPKKSTEDRDRERERAVAELQSLPAGSAAQCRRAVELVRAHVLPCRLAAGAIGRPKSWLHDRASGKVAIDARLGRPSIVHPAVEAYFFRWLLHMARGGHAHTVAAAAHELQAALKAVSGGAVFKGDDQAERWVRDHMDKHDLSLHRPHDVSRAEAAATVDYTVLAQYYQEFEAACHAVWGKRPIEPHLLFNIDETDVTQNTTPAAMVRAVSKLPLCVYGSDATHTSVQLKRGERALERRNCVCKICMIELQC